MILGKSVGAVIIGRNEGERLLRCLASLPDTIDHTVYVDSGSTDGSIEAARAKGAKVVSLDMATPFTAARARNAGFAKLLESRKLDFVQFIDGDCELREGWVELAIHFMLKTPEAAVACGRRRERFAEASVYNRLCDWEWNTPIGQTKSCGGDALIRSVSFEEVRGFNPSLIAGEEPELCLRLRAKGWQIWRLDHEMTWHDAAITQFSQWWKRNRRSGYAFAEGAKIHGAPPERHWVRQTQRIAVWGILIPILIMAAALLLSFWCLFGLIIYPLQTARIARREGGSKVAWEVAIFWVLGIFPQAVGVLEFWRKHLWDGNVKIIEYK